MKPVFLAVVLTLALTASGWYLGLAAKGSLQGATVSAIAGALGGIVMAVAICGLKERVNRLRVHQ